MIESTFLQILRNESSITDLVGENIFPVGSATTNDLYMVYQMLSRKRPAWIDNTPAKQNATFQLDIYGARLNDTSSLVNAVVKTMHYKSNHDFFNKIQIIRIDNERTNFIKEEKLFNKSLDISLFFD